MSLQELILWAIVARTYLESTGLFHSDDGASWFVFREYGEPGDLLPKDQLKACRRERFRKRHAALS